MRKKGKAVKQIRALCQMPISGPLGVLAGVLGFDMSYLFKLDNTKQF